MREREERLTTATIFPYTELSFVPRTQLNRAIEIHMKKKTHFHPKMPRYYKSRKVLNL